MITKNEYVVVNDGGTRWLADRDDLIETMEKLGWNQQGKIWTEPPADDPSRQYTLLCENVADWSERLPKNDWEGIPQFFLRQDLGIDVWQLEQA